MASAPLKRRHVGPVPADGRVAEDRDWDVWVYWECELVDGGGGGIISWAKGWEDEVPEWDDAREERNLLVAILGATGGVFEREGVMRTTARPPGRRMNGDGG